MEICRVQCTRSSTCFVGIVRRDIALGLSDVMEHGEANAICTVGVASKVLVIASLQSQVFLFEAFVFEILGAQLSWLAKCLDVVSFLLDHIDLVAIFRAAQQESSCVKLSWWL